MTDKGKEWSVDEIATLRRLYSEGGSRAVHEALPHRSRSSIKVKAHKLDDLRVSFRGRCPQRFTAEKIEAALAAARAEIAARDALERHRGATVIAAEKLGCAYVTVARYVREQHLARIAAAKARREAHRERLVGLAETINATAQDEEIYA